ncbi:Alpha/Beta hydrolase protein [Microdochium bolleyi]|uniref:Alpha/Beta hydrolase protein n=1 Tax=Microdochium bolleyi TaxID=196109 RepID=A0A136J949_9PEZI|nr:Alpha/Beta hydrolase protein [Microdochium bolleyi]
MAPEIAPPTAYALPEDHLFHLPGHRGTLSYMIFGDPSAPPDRTVFYNHGTGSSLLDAYLYDAAARKRHIRVVGVDRPGSGKSPLRPGHSSAGAPPRRIADWPADIRALAEHLGATRFAMIGVSGGGPHTYACVDAIPPNQGLVGACVLASAYPKHFGTEGMSLVNKFMFWICAWSPWVVEKIFEFGMGGVAKDDGESPEKLARMLDQGFRGRPAPDREAWEHGAREESGDVGVEPSVFRAVMAESIRRALRDGCKGAAWDLYAVAVDWGFKLEDLAGRVQSLEGKDPDKTKLVVLHGRQDINCPVSTAFKAQQLFPEADWRIRDGDAHVSILVNTPVEVMDAVDKMFSD